MSAVARALRQWVLSLAHALRFFLATNSEALTVVLGEVYRTISRHLIGKAGLTRTSGATGMNFMTTNGQLRESIRARSIARRSTVIHSPPRHLSRAAAKERSSRFPQRSNIPNLPDKKPGGSPAAFP
jgi:hypothetical protein